MKIVITLLLCFSLASPLTPKAKAVSTEGVLCVSVGIAAVLAIVGVTLFAQKCKTDPYCYKNPETGEQYCRQMTKSRAASCGTNVVAGPFTSTSDCASNCATNHANGMAAQVAGYDDPGDALPRSLFVERSIDDMKTWQTLATVALDPSMESQEVYHDQEAGLPRAFYRFRYN